MYENFITLMQRRVGNVSIGASAARGLPTKTIEAARNFFHNFDLNPVKSLCMTEFPEWLNTATYELKKSLPYGAQYWGSSRKFLNIFLRDCLYNRYLCEQFQVSKLEEWLEVPLDSHVGIGLRGEKEGQNLPKWINIIGLTDDISTSFQKVALDVANREKVARVHLDIKYWRGPHMANAHPADFAESLNIDLGRTELPDKISTTSSFKEAATLHLEHHDTNSPEFKNRALGYCQSMKQAEAIQRAATDLNINLKPSYLQYPGSHIDRWRKQGFPK